MKNNKIWFVNKTYGYGWTPYTWEGWLVLFIWFIFFLPLTLFIKYNFILGFIGIIFITSLLLFICYKKGEKPCWQWGKKINKYMYRKGVAAIIVNKNQGFLLINLISFEEKYFAIPGGGSENNESIEETVYREIKEELGIEKYSLELIGKSEKPLQFKFKEIKLSRDGVEYKGSEKYYFGFKFIGEDSEIKLKKDEVRSYKWVSFSDLKDYLLFDNQLKDTEDKIKEIFVI